MITNKTVYIASVALLFSSALYSMEKECISYSPCDTALYTHKELEEHMVIEKYNSREFYGIITLSFKQQHINLKSLISNAIDQEKTYNKTPQSLKKPGDLQHTQVNKSDLQNIGFKGCLVEITYERPWYNKETRKISFIPTNNTYEPILLKAPRIEKLSEN